MQYSQILWAVLYGCAFFGETPGLEHRDRRRDHHRSAASTSSSARTRRRLEDPAGARTQIALRDRHLPADQQLPPAVRSKALSAGGPAEPASRAADRRRPLRCRATCGVTSARCRSVAQPGSAPASGAGGRRFESSHSDQHVASQARLPGRASRRRGERPAHVAAADRPDALALHRRAAEERGRERRLRHRGDRRGLRRPRRPTRSIYVDDGSTDDTAARVLALRERFPMLRLVRHAASAGQSAAIHSGVTLARGEVICTLDGDGQNPPSEIPKLAARLDGPALPRGRRR